MEKSIGDMITEFIDNQESGMDLVCIPYYSQYDDMKKFISLLKKNGIAIRDIKIPDEITKLDTDMDFENRVICIPFDSVSQISKDEVEPLVAVIDKFKKRLDELYEDIDPYLGY